MGKLYVGTSDGSHDVCMHYYVCPRYCIIIIYFTDKMDPKTIQGATIGGTYFKVVRVPRSVAVCSDLSKMEAIKCHNRNFKSARKLATTTPYLRPVKPHSYHP